MRDYKQLSFEERKKIYFYLEMRLSISKIAKKLGKNRSAIYREIKRNSVSGKYVGSIANEIALTRRSQGRKNKIRDNKQLNNYIGNKLELGWSPEQISGRLKLDNPGYYTCTESIYRYIYQEKKREWYKYLHYKKKCRCRRYTRKKQVRYSGGKSIHIRKIGKECGHWEGDTVFFAGSKRASITTLVEKKTLYTLLAKNNFKDSKKVMGKIRELMATKPKKYWRSIAFDQGAEFADFRQIEGKTKCLIYYCDAHAPWQRGVNENTNWRLRRYLPRTIDINNLTEKMLMVINKKMNKTPRKKLGFLMPQEALELEFKKYCRT